jgi:phosphoribosyl 1,2-cyclic phosphodiesterase
VRNHLSLAALEARLADIRPKRLILTHMADDMLGRLDAINHDTAHDGMIVEV